MARGVLLVVVLALSAQAVAAPSALTAPSPVAAAAAPPLGTPSPEAPPPPVPPLRTALYVGSATLLCVAAGTVAGLIGSTLPSARFEALGRPDPLALAGGFTLAFAANFGLLHLLLPELGRLANADGVSGSPVAARAEAWRVGRWAALAAVVGLTTLTVGAGLEHGGFARGQELMLAGAATFLLSAIAWDVLEAVFSWRGFVASRSAAPR